VIRAQRTLRSAVEFSGRGLHSGEVVDVRILPAPQGTGVEFLRTDLPEAVPIPANIRFHSERDRRTHLERDGCYVDTVEHLLAVCNGLHVDNLRVELSGSELPGMDGSSRTLVDLFLQAGLVEQRASARVFRLQEPIYVRDGEATLVALPAEHASLTL
jgi:UDP-3-O-acyl-N-acetylglucosamine deacetylase